MAWRVGGEWGKGRSVQGGRMGGDGGLGVGGGNGGGAVGVTGGLGGVGVRQGAWCEGCACFVGSVGGLCDRVTSGGRLLAA